jgi:beta-lactamase class A
MKRLLRALTALVALAAGAACSATPATVPTAPARPPATATSLPAATPTAVPVAAEVQLGDIALGGLTPDAARAAIEQYATALQQPFEVVVGERRVAIDPDDIALRIDRAALLAEVLAAPTATRIAATPDYDAEALGALLDSLAEDVRVPTSSLLITASDVISASFVVTGGARLDVSSAQQTIAERLASGMPLGEIELPLVPLTPAEMHPEPAALQQALETLAARWGDVAGVYVYDLAGEREIAAVHARTVFNAASTIKTAIMLNAYLSLTSFDDEQDQAMKQMIEQSDNLAANDLMSWSINWPGTEGAIQGANLMSDRLAALGLEHTYLYTAYESADYVRQNRITLRAGPEQAGDPPYTANGRYLRTTPYEMAQLYRMLDECARGTGVLLEQHGDMLDAARCREMLERLALNEDDTRMVAGLPPGTVAQHKSGWIDDMHADAGIVRSPGGDYVVAIYLFRPAAPGTAVADRVMRETIAGFSRLVYSYFNPTVVDALPVEP